MDINSSPSEQPTRTKILNILADANNWVSGEHISELLGVSRAAVAKHIALLRKKGHAIKALPRKGYWLEASASDLDLSAIQKQIPDTIFSETEWSYMPELSSTNTEALVRAGLGAPHGTLILSELQTAGRGRKNTDWFSAPRSLQFSVILRPNCPTPDINEITFDISVLLADAIKLKTNINPTIKKPNDVYINGKKVAGVLVESGFRADTLDWLIVGIGLNVNTLISDFPPELQQKCTSILIEQGNPSNRGEMLSTILQHLDFWYKQIQGKRK